LPVVALASIAACAAAAQARSYSCHPRAGLPGQLDEQRPHAPAGRLDQHGLARRQAGPAHQAERGATVGQQRPDDPTPTQVDAWSNSPN
jgi:hypothetical protein